MSTKIYNGYKLESKPKSLSEVRDIIYSFKQKAVEHYREKFFTIMGRDFAFIIDTLKISKHTDYKFMDMFKEDEITVKELLDNSYLNSRSLLTLLGSSLSGKANIFREQHSRVHDYSDYDFYCTVVILPCQDEVFLLLYGEDSKIYKLFKETQGIVEYPYWDNTDPPEDKTWEEWDERGKEWDEAIISDIPSKSGFTIDIVVEPDDVQHSWCLNEEQYENLKEQVLLHVPPIRDRMMAFARQRLYIEWKEINSALIEEAQDDGMWFRIYDLFCAYVKANPDLLNEKIEEFAKLTKEKLTKDDLLKTVPMLYEEFGINPLEETTTEYEDV